MTDHGTLLIVEDDEIFVTVLSEAMTRRGFDCLTAATLDEAAAHIGGGRLDFAVLDLNLAGQSSLSLVAPLKARHPDIRIVVLTGYASIATAVDAVKLGVDEYLTKPADADQIQRALTTATHPGGAEIPKRPMSVRRLEWEHIQRVLADCNGNVSEAARRLNMHRRTLQRKLLKHPVTR